VSEIQLEVTVASREACPEPTRTYLRRVTSS
jgi:hypothetical protein